MACEKWIDVYWEMEKMEGQGRVNQPILFDGFFLLRQRNLTIVLVLISASRERKKKSFLSFVSFLSLFFKYLLGLCNQSICCIVICSLPLPPNGTLLQETSIYSVWTSLNYEAGSLRVEVYSFT